MVVKYKEEKMIENKNVNFKENNLKQNHPKNASIFQQKIFHNTVCCELS